MLTEEFLFALVGRATSVNNAVVLDAVQQDRQRVRWWSESPAAPTVPKSITCVSSTTLAGMKHLTVGSGARFQQLLKELQPQGDEVLGLAPGSGKRAAQWLQEYLHVLAKHAPSHGKGIANANERKVTADDRAAVMSARRALLDRVDSLTSEELAKRRDSFTSNASQLAADLRAKHDIFGVRIGKEWRYPAFQFEKRGEPKAVLRDILQALGEDARGWDTLQWFLSPHESLTSRQVSDRDQMNTGRPIDLLNVDPDSVLMAARAEHWRVRD